nr:hypothetical protein [Enterococcus faecium]
MDSWRIKNLKEAATKYNSKYFLYYISIIKIEKLGCLISIIKK